ncbi:adenylyl-sulfate kinase [Candidatus Peregrinibacteria bacterium]|nr:adenylyl-sulfate kinase [Candidatus Peregrinibacteria bacterium]
MTPFPATKRKRCPVVWLTGNSGAGKSTLAFGIRDYLNEQTKLESPLHRRVIVLDGDEMRATVSVDEGFSPEDRRRHNLRMARLANLLSEHGFVVIVSVIAPFERVRQEVQDICNPVWVYVKRSNLEAADRPYEPPISPALLIDNDLLSIDEGHTQFKGFLEQIAVIQTSNRVAASAVH